MNYFAHGLAFIDRPHFLAGTAAPDWMSVADRAVRIRPRLVEPLVTEPAPFGETAAGILQHFQDDEWFHATRAFALTTAELTRRFDRAFPEDTGLRPGFLGHITTEMLLDAVLIRSDPHRLDAYYAALSLADPGTVQAVVNRCARGKTERLTTFIGLFHQERFLSDYLEMPRLLYRLNQVLRRVKLQPLPGTAVDVLEFGCELVAARREDLLPPDRWNG